MKLLYTFGILTYALLMIPLLIPFTITGLISSMLIGWDITSEKPFTSILFPILWLVNKRNEL